MDFDPKTAIFSVSIDGEDFLLGTGATFKAMAEEKGFPIPNHLDPDKFYLCDRDDCFKPVENVKVVPK